MPSVKNLLKTPYLVNQRLSRGGSNFVNLALSTDFLRIVEDPLKGLLMDKGGSLQDAQVDMLLTCNQQVILLLGKVEAIINDVRRMNKLHQGGYMTPFYHGHGFVPFWRLRNECHEALEVEYGETLKFRKGSMLRVFDQEFECVDAIERLIKRENADLYRYYRSVEFALLEVMARLGYFVSIKDWLGAMQDKMDRRKSLSKRERDKVVDLLKL